MTKTQHELLRDIWLTYEMQMAAMESAKKNGQNVTASLHNRMAKQLLETYFDMIDKLLVRVE